MKIIGRKILVSALAVFGCVSAANAEGWCDLEPGWTVITHGSKINNVFIQGKLVGGPTWIWMQIASPEIGQANVAVALTAQAAGKGLTIYLDLPEATCANYPSWAPMGTIRHVKMNN